MDPAAYCAIVWVGMPAVSDIAGGSPTCPPAALPGAFMRKWSTEDVVISGVACRLPQSDNMEEFRQHLLNKDDMVTEDDSRWKPGYIGVPKRYAKIKDITKFDALFFGVNPKQADVMDPGLRILFECVYESIVDAGMNRTKLKGSLTGVYVGSATFDALEGYSKDVDKISGYELSGCQRAMLANRISFFFDLHGPSMVVDTACSSSLLALDIALQDIRTGKCDSAIVGGINLCLNPITSLQFYKLGMLSDEGACKSCDASASGYCRGEGIQAVFLQKEADAKRVYATIVHSKNNCDGFIERGILFPSREAQTSLMKQVYEEAQVDPEDVNYIEAHATGTAAGDPQELNAIADVFCSTSKRRKESPLLISCVKSSTGHLEGTAGLAAIAKTIVAMEDLVIPGNIHYNEPNPDVEKLLSGEMKPVTEHTPWSGGYCAINSFGWGGSNVHALLQSNQKEKLTLHPAANSERLFTFSGRTEEGLQVVLYKMESDSSNVELQALLQENAETDTTGHPYRGYAVLNVDQQMLDIQKCESTDRPVWFVMTGMGAQWPKMGRGMMGLAPFRNSIQRSDAILQQVDYHLCDVLLREDDAFEKPLHSFIGLMAIQIALIDVLKQIGIRPDGIIGHSVGELACAYADGSMTASETLLTTYHRGKCVLEHVETNGGMAAVGMSWEETKDRLPEGIYAACHNTLNTQTISGPSEQISDFVTTLQKEGVFAKQVNSAGIPFHSPYMEPALEPLAKKLEKVLVGPRPRRSAKWISTSVPQEDLDKEEAQVVGPPYIINNLRNPVLFQEAINKIPANAIVIEIGAHGLLLPMLKRAELGPGISFHSLMQRKNTQNATFLLSSLGRLYTQGVNFNPLNLHPRVKFPVPRGTPMISPLLRWDHSKSWDVPKAEAYVEHGVNGTSTQTFKLDLSEGGDFEYLLGHIIDGHTIMPAAGYIELAWKACAKLNGSVDYRKFPVVVEDLKFHRVTPLKATTVTFDVSIGPGDGHFEIREADHVVVTGRISPAGNPVFHFPCPDVAASDGNFPVLDFKDINKEMTMKAFHHSGQFQGIMELSNTGKTGYLNWTGNWTTFIDTMIQAGVFQYGDRAKRLPTRIASIRIDPTAQEQYVEDRQFGKGCLLKMDFDVGVLRCGAVEITDCHLSLVSRLPNTSRIPALQHVCFVPYVEENLFSSDATWSQHTEVCKVVAKKQLTRECQRPNANLPETVQNELPINEAEIRRRLAGPKSTPLSVLAGKGAEQPMGSLSKDRFLKTTFDVAVENTLGNHIRVCEYIGQGQQGIYQHYLPQTDIELLLTRKVRLFGEDLSHLDTDKLTKHGAEITTWNLKGDAPRELTDADLVVASYAPSSEDDVPIAVKQLGSLLKDGGFLMVHELTNHLKNSCLQTDDNVRDAELRTSEPAWEQLMSDAGFEMVVKKSDGLFSTLFLFRKLHIDTIPNAQSVIEVGDITDYKWIEEIKQAMRDSPDVDQGRKIWLKATSQRHSGIVGLMNSLKLEPGGERLRSIVDASLGDCPLKLKPEHFSNLVKKDLVMNVFRDGAWGSFRHLQITEGVGQQTVETAFAYVKTTKKGDLSSFKWFESPLRHTLPSTEGDDVLCSVYYSALNFRDIMDATGRLQHDAIPDDLARLDTILGLDWAGRDPEGHRVFGLVPAMSLATVVHAPRRFVWPCPDHWSLAEASTIPVVYSTAYYALVLRGNIQKGDCVLIHSGAGGVGQAAIAIALSYDCAIFTTCSSQEKKDFLKKRFPQLKEECFASSRDNSFEAHVLKQTNGRGCDLVLNSLAEDKLHASLRCVAKHGTFLEIGKYDLANNTKMGMRVLLKDTTVCGVQVDSLLLEGDRRWSIVYDLVSRGIKDGVVTPIQTNVFESDKIEQAFRFMSRGKHIGKVVIKIRNEENERMCQAAPIGVRALTRAACNPQKTYIITGGLGGFGMELGYWLFERGCRRLLLTSRSGITTGYQSRTIRILREHGVHVKLSDKDVGIREQAWQLIEEAVEMGPVGGVFHLAAVLEDGLIDNQTVDTFKAVSHPKIKGVTNLDAVTRKMCAESLDWFVAFSSLASGSGILGQSNYAFANSFMERVCEQRKHDGLPGLAIQWGNIADVGMFMTVGDNDTELAGAIPQPFLSCLETLDLYLCQDKPVVSSWVVADKTPKENDKDTTKDILTIVFNILGLGNSDAISDSQTLSSFGMDSLMGVEIQHALRDTNGLIMTMQQIRALSFKDIKEMTSGCCVAKKRNETHA